MSYQLINASAHQTGLPSESINCVVTSPPYMALRRYAGDQEIDWIELEYSPMPGLPVITIPAMRCGLGAEPTIEAYIGHLILVMREMWRVLKMDGTCWVNLGDSYAGSGGAHTHDHANPGLSKSANRDGVAHYAKDGGRGIDKGGNGIKAKDMMLIPQRFVLAAQADGWYVRSAMPWLKRNGMPDSCTDRPSQVIENVFLLAKSERYFFDMEAVKMPISENSVFTGLKAGHHKNGERYSGTHKIEHGSGGQMKPTNDTGTRNFRSSDPFFKTWQGLVSNDGDPLAMVVNTSGYSAAHFACWPPALVEIMIKAGSSAHGVCVKCKAPWERVVEREATEYNSREGVAQALRNQGAQNGGTDKVTLGMTHLVKRETTGWQPTCACNCDEVEPAVVLDCFSGAATTGKVALQLGRSYIGIDVSEQYLSELAPARMSNLQIEMAW